MNYNEPDIRVFSTRSVMRLSVMAGAVFFANGYCPYRADHYRQLVKFAANEPRRLALQPCEDCTTSDGRTNS